MSLVPLWSREAARSIFKMAAMRTIFTQMAHVFRICADALDVCTRGLQIDEGVHLRDGAGRYAFVGLENAAHGGAGLDTARRRRQMRFALRPLYTRSQKGMVMLLYSSASSAGETSMPSLIHFCTSMAWDDAKKYAT